MSEIFSSATLNPISLHFSCAIDDLRMDMTYLLVAFFCVSDLPAVLLAPCCDNCENQPTDCQRCRNTTRTCSEPSQTTRCGIVQSPVCPDSRFFGTQCDQNCSDACVNSRCALQKTTLVCTDGCIEGKKGIYCQEDCLSTCSKCERYGSVCLQCRDALSYGKKCDKRCPPNCKGGCAKETCICTACASGFKGAKCKTSCRPDCECPRYTEGCYRCLSDRYYGKDCRFPYPQNCLQCKKDTGDCTECVHGYSGKQCTEHVQKLDPYTVLITCSTLGVVLFGGVLLFLHKLCSYRHQRRPETNPQTGNQNTSTRDVADRHGTLNHESRGYDVPHKYWEIHDTDLDRVTQSTASVQTGEMEGVSNTMRYHPKPDIPKKRCEDGRLHPVKCPTKVAASGDADNHPMAAYFGNRKMDGDARPADLNSLFEDHAISNSCDGLHLSRWIQTIELDMDNCENSRSVPMPVDTLTAIGSGISHVEKSVDVEHVYEQALPTV